MRRAPRLLLTAFGIGRMRPGPGTWGSLPPIALVLALVSLNIPPWQTNAAIGLLGLLFAIACLRFGEEEELACGRNDPSHIVADEVAGQCLALLWLPWRAGGDFGACRVNILLAMIAFASFRCLDILKPPPIRQLQRLRGGIGILADDLAAGALGLLVTQLAARLLVVPV